MCIRDRKKAPAAPKVLACAGRVRGEAFDGTNFTFSTAGPINTTLRARIKALSEPKSITTVPELAVDAQWDATSGTLLLAFPNMAQEVRVQVVF